MRLSTQARGETWTSLKWMSVPCCHCRIRKSRHKGAMLLGVSRGRKPTAELRSEMADNTSGSHKGNNAIVS
jgi:hypothetical protein